MADNREQRAAVKFVFCYRESAAKTFVVVETIHGDLALSKS